MAYQSQKKLADAQKPVVAARDAAYAASAAASDAGARQFASHDYFPTAAKTNARAKAAWDKVRVGALDLQSWVNKQSWYPGVAASSNTETTDLQHALKMLAWASEQATTAAARMGELDVALAALKADLLQHFKIKNPNAPPPNVAQAAMTQGGSGFPWVPVLGVGAVVGVGYLLFR